MFEPNNDGIDHVNIYSQGKTELGNWLSNFSYSPINIPEHGLFKSIEGYWYWLGTKDDSLRYLIGYQAKKKGKKLKCIEICNDEFIGFIKKAIDIKIKSDTRMMEQLIISELPFTHYYVFGGVKREAGYEWIVEHIEDRRRLLKEWRKNKSERKN